MNCFLLPLFTAGWLLGCGADTNGISYLYQPSFCRTEDPRGPAFPYLPQPGDIFLATDRAFWARAGHWVVGGAGVHHSGILFRGSDGRIALLEAGPFNSVTVEKLDPLQHMRNHMAKGDRVWIRRRCQPLTPDQSTCLTAFAEAQVGKPFAIWRLMAQVTVLRSRGPVRTWFIGKPHGERSSYFCSELVTECCVAAGLVDAESARPPATYPRDLFFGKSFNWYLNTHLQINDGWWPPARWTECPV